MKRFSESGNLKTHLKTHINKKKKSLNLSPGNRLLKSGGANDTAATVQTASTIGKRKRNKVFIKKPSDKVGERVISN